MVFRCQSQLNMWIYFRVRIEVSVVLKSVELLCSLSTDFLAAAEVITPLGTSNPSWESLNREVFILLLLTSLSVFCWFVGSPVWGVSLQLELCSLTVRCSHCLVSNLQCIWSELLSNSQRSCVSLCVSLPVSVCGFQQKDRPLSQTSAFTPASAVQPRYQNTPS